MDNYQILSPCVNDSGFTISNLKKEYRVTVTHDHDVCGIFDFAAKNGKGKEVTSEAEKSLPYDKRTRTFVYDQQQLVDNPEQAAWLNETVSKQKAVFVTKDKELKAAKMEAVEKYGPELTEQKLGADFRVGVPPAFGTNKTPFVRGEVFKVGEYFVGLKTGTKDNVQFFQLVPVSNLLNGADEFKNRWKTINSRFKVGQNVEVRFDDKKKLQEVKSYTPKVKTDTPTNPADATLDTWTRRAEDALEAYDEHKKGNPEVTALAVSVKASQAASSYAHQLHQSGKLPPDGGTIEIPKEFQGKPELEEGFKIGFNDMYHNIYTANEKPLTYKTDEATQDAALDKITKPATAKKRAPSKKKDNKPSVSI